VLGAAQPDQRHGRPGSLEPIPVVTQLRDVLAAERSPEVAQEHKYGRARRPGRGQPDLAPAGVQHDGVRCEISHLDHGVEITDG
jgi:hypothetical protein